MALKFFSFLVSHITWNAKEFMDSTIKMFILMQKNLRTMYRIFNELFKDTCTMDFKISKGR